MTDTESTSTFGIEPLDLSQFVTLANISLAKHPIPDGSHGWEDLADGALIRGLAQAVLVLAKELEQAQAENAAHVQDMAQLVEALDPLQAIVAYGSVNNDPRLWTEVRD